MPLATTRAKTVASARALAIVVALATAPAHAAGLWNFDQGVSNYGRAGANIAAPTDPTAVYLNPAALAGQRGFQFFAMADAIVDDRGFERSPDAFGRPRFCCRQTTYDPVVNEHPVFPPSPGLWMSWNAASLGLPKLSLGAALYGPPRSDATLPADGAQRYSLIESHHLQIHSALAAAYELPWKKTRVGMTAMAINQYVDTSLAFNVYPAFGFPEDRGWDADVVVHARDPLIPAFIGGVSLEPIPHVTVAASYQHSYDVEAKGRARGTVGEDLGALGSLRPGELTVELRMPAIARGAVRFDAPAGRWNAEAAFVYENWSRNDEVNFRPKQPRGLALDLEALGLTRAVDDITVPTHFRDTWSVRLGGEWFAVPEKVAVRGGVFYERAAIAPEWLNMANFDLDKIGLSLGGRYDIASRGWIELAAGYQHWMPVEVENSRVRIIDPLSSDELWPIGNGKYTNTRIQVMAGAGVRFGG